MGPSGCGKTTLLNVLARRAATSGAKTMGECHVNGGGLDNATFGRITSYVEQEDALIGSLTVQETLKFAADLSLPRYASNHCSLCYKANRQGLQLCFKSAAA
jgi:ABC-type multidrug transport system ATPase subunit